MSLFRELNHWRIDSSKALLLKIIRGLFDQPQLSAPNKALPELKYVRKILALHFDDKIGDLVVNSSIFRELKGMAPQSEIDLVTGRNAAPLIAHNPHLHEIILFRKGLFPTLKLARVLKRKKYDLVIDLRLMTDSRTIYILNQMGQNFGTFRIGLNKLGHAVYDLSTEKDFRRIHASLRVGTLINSLGAPSPNLKYDLHFSEAELSTVKAALTRFSNEKFRFIILNPFAGARFRSFQLESVRRISAAFHKHYPDYFIIVTGSPSDRDFLKKCETELSAYQVHYLPEVKTLTELCALTSLSSGVISPDTSLVHIASAYNKNIISFFRDDTGDAERNSVQWAPASAHAEVILCKGKTNGYLDVNSFEEQDLSKALKNFITPDNLN